MNQIILPTAELKQALPGLSKVISRRSTLPVLSTVKVSRDDAGRVSLSASDLDTFVTYHVEQAQPGKPLDVLLPFERLNDSAKGLKGEMVVIVESPERVKLHYQIGDSPLEQGVTTLKPAEFPSIPKITQPVVKMPANFGETLRQAFETSSEDSSRYVLHGAYLDVSDPKCHTIVSTNGRSLFAANSFQFDLKESVNIARHKFLAWSGFWEGECRLVVQSDKAKTSYVQLSTPRWNCISKQIDGLFPRWRQVLPDVTSAWTSVQLMEAAVDQMLRLSFKLPGDDTPNRTLRLQVNEELRLEGRNKDDKDWTGAGITGVKITGKSVVTALNREYLRVALRCGLNEVRILDEFTPLVFTSKGRQMIVMPVALKGPATTTSAPKPGAAPQPTTPPNPEATAQPQKEVHMTKTAKNPAGTAPDATTQSPETKSAIAELISQVDQIKDNLRNVIRDLNTVGDLLKTAEKEKKASFKEVESVRATLRSLQKVAI